MNILLILFFTTIITTITYCTVIFRYFLAWRNFLPTVDENSKIDDFPFVSVIIPFRNEKDNFQNLLESLKNQSYPANLLEIIAVDDHSTDETVSIINFENVKILKNSGIGKKDALKTGIYKACGEIILTIDADCIPEPFWIETIAKNYQLKKPSMMQGPVKMRSDNSLLSRFQSIDYMSLQMCGAGAIILNKSVFCSGANLSFVKNDWLEAIDIVSGKKILSGDDVFLLHTIKKQKKTIIFIKDTNACVTTKTEEKISDFIRQRMRWGGKSLEYRDLSTIFLALIVFLCNFFLIVSACSLFFVPNLIFPFSLVLKMFFDYLLLKEGSDFYKLKMSVGEFILFSIIYPFYLSFVAIGSFFVKTEWKGRKKSYSLT